MHIYEGHARRVFKVHGKTTGSGYLLQGKKILTAAHLGFKLASYYTVYNQDNKAISVICEHISNKGDFAILYSEELTTEKIIEGMQNPEWIFTYW